MSEKGVTRMEVYVLEVYDQGKRVASLDGEGNWECSDYEKMKGVVKIGMAEILKKCASDMKFPNGGVVNKYTAILLQRQADV